MARGPQRPLNSLLLYGHWEVGNGGHLKQEKSVLKTSTFKLGYRQCLLFENFCRLREC